MTVHPLVSPASFGKYYLERIQNAIERDHQRKNWTSRTTPHDVQRFIHVRWLSGDGFSNAYDYSKEIMRIEESIS